MIKMFDHLIGMKIGDTEITEELVDKSVSRLITFRRKSKKDHESSDAFIIQEYITDEDVIRNIASANNLKPKTVDTSVKFDDVRNMSLGLDNLEGYTEAEKSFVQQRLCVYKSFYFGDGVSVAPNDEFQILDLIDMELDIQQLKTFTKLNKKCEEEKKALKEMRSQYSKALQDLNVKKQQRDNVKKPKDNGSTISDQLNEFEQSIEELQHDIESEEQEELEMLARKK
jgi:hypothetical protein